MLGFQAIAITLFMTLLVVMIHHEALEFVARVFLPSFSKPRRWHVGATIVLLIVAHVIEISVCGLALFLSGEYLGLGGLLGSNETNLQTYLYFSIASYTSLGIGDIFPVGHLRLMTGIEALLGLLMIGWTASFILLEMRSYFQPYKTRDG